MFNTFSAPWVRWQSYGASRPTRFREEGGGKVQVQWSQNTCSSAGRSPQRAWVARRSEISDRKCHEGDGGVGSHSWGAIAIRPSLTPVYHFQVFELPPSRPFG